MILTMDLQHKNYDKVHEDCNDYDVGDEVGDDDDGDHRDVDVDTQGKH